MKKVVIKVDIQDGKDKRKVMKAVAALSSIDSITIDLKDQKLTVIGAVDPIHLMSKLKKCCASELLTVGPAPKADEKKDDKKKEDEKKKEDQGKKEDEKKKSDPAMEQRHIQELVNSYRSYNPNMTQYYQVVSAEENPNSCVVS